MRATPFTGLRSMTGLPLKRQTGALTTEAGLSSQGMLGKGPPVRIFVMVSSSFIINRPQWTGSFAAVSPAQPSVFCRFPHPRGGPACKAIIHHFSHLEKREGSPFSRGIPLLCHSEARPASAASIQNKRSRVRTAYPRLRQEPSTQNELSTISAQFGDKSHASAKFFAPAWKTTGAAEGIWPPARAVDNRC